MDASAFDLARNPFLRSPDLDEACLPNSMAALLAELNAGLRSPQGVSVLAGEAGVGKSLAASVFLRRLEGGARATVAVSPVSSAAAIARDALANLDPEGEGNGAEDWVAALRDLLVARAAAGQATVLLVDEAEKLSPQALDDLAALFDDDEPVGLHLFLVGRPVLVEKIHAGSERALLAHLLQICRVEPLSLRESVRYLERRLAICGGEMSAMFTDDAVDELMRACGGRLVQLEMVAEAALARAAARGERRATAQDVDRAARSCVEQEVVTMAPKQQPLRFELEEDALAEDEWQADEDDVDEDDWSEDGAEQDEWEADGEEEADDLDWEAAERADDADEVVAARPRGSSAGGAGPRKETMVGRAVLSVAACVGLVWVANQLPGPSRTEPRGRDAKPFAERLSSDPAQIRRLALSAEAADADAHVLAWKQQPPGQKDREVREVASSASAGSPGQGAVAAGPAIAPQEVQGPPAPIAVAAVSPAAQVPPAQPVAAAEAAVPAAPTRPASAAASSPKPKMASTPKPTAKAPVYTVQLGAFKARRNAEQLAGKLRGKSPRILEEGGLYRVVSGSFSSRRDAQSHEASLRRAGYTTYVRTAVF